MPAMTISMCESSPADGVDADLRPVVSAYEREGVVLLRGFTPDLEAFPCLALAFEAGRRGGGAPAALSAANEVAVEAFLDRRIPWLAIAEVNRVVLESWLGNVATVADVLEADRTARERARTVVDRLTRGSK